MAARPVILILCDNNDQATRAEREMKTTVEIPDDLFRQAKAQAALRGIRLRELVEYGLRLALETPPPPAGGQRTAFPLIKASADAPRLTEEQVQAALIDMNEEEAQRHAGSVRH